MLIPLGWFRIIAIRCSHPIQSSISMFSQPPCIIQWHAVTPSPTKYNHHPTCRSCSADTGWVVDSGRRILRACIDFFPDAIASNIDFPDIPYSLWTCIASIEYDIRFEIGHNMSIASTRCWSFTIFDLPISFVCECEKIELIKVIICELASTQCTPKYIEKVIDWDCIMGCSVRRRDAVIIEFFPFSKVIIK